jgi:D-glycero-D-manno-heptose 1,7-bisphosphate phosphatase
MEGLLTANGVIWNGSTVPALCLDLDGTVRLSKRGENKFINGPDDVTLYPGVEEKIWEYRDAGYLIFGLTNQGGVAMGYKTPEQVNAEIDAMFSLFKRSEQGMGPFHSLKSCFHMEGEKASFPYNRRSLLRKPDVGMLVLMEVEAFYAGFLIDWDASLLVGDRPEDEQCAANAGIPFQWAKDFFCR